MSLKPKLPDNWAHAEKQIAQEKGKPAQETLQAGLPVTYLKNGCIVRKYPDGREEALSKVPKTQRATQKRFKLGR